jgi:hypothetical protein
LTLAGPILAYEESSTTLTRYSTPGEHYVSEWHVIVRDLRTGRVLHKVPTGPSESTPEARLVGAGPASIVVAKRDGAVAWITETAQLPHSYQVHAVDRTGARLLAVGSDIRPRSLTLARSTLHWTQGRKLFSAVLR